MNKTSYRNDFFGLDWTLGEKATEITMTLFTHINYTDQIPNTISILGKSIPSIFNAKCFNEEKIPFKDEVLKTEIGHLFEHILLEYLSEAKYTHDNCKTPFSGITRWDWRKEPGVYRIKIDSGCQEEKIFSLALEKSTSLLESIVRSALKDNKAN